MTRSPMQAEDSIPLPLVTLCLFSSISGRCTKPVSNSLKHQPKTWKAKPKVTSKAPPNKQFRATLYNIVSRGELELTIKVLLELETSAADLKRKGIVRVAPRVMAEFANYHSRKTAQTVLKVMPDSSLLRLLPPASCCSGRERSPAVGDV